MTRFVYVLPAGHLRPASYLRWEVRVNAPFSETREFPISLFYRRKAHALIAARAIAIVIGGEVQPHNRWGRIQDPDSYGNDPKESRG